MLNFFREQKAEPEKELQARLEKEGWQFLTVDRFSPRFRLTLRGRVFLEPTGPEVSRAWYEKQFGTGRVRIERAYENGRPLPQNKYAAVYVKPREP